MKKVVLIVGVLLAMYWLEWKIQHRTAHKPVIAVLQIANHAALDAARDAFIAVIKEKTGNAYQIVVKNADGSAANAQVIAQSLVSRDDVVAFYALGTPALQALASKEHARPIFYAAVTYPEKLKLTARNIAGASDYFDLDNLIEYVHELMPAAQRVGILYNPGTEVAQHELKTLEDGCKKRGLVPVSIAGVTEGDLIASLKSSLRKVDVCVAPTDNMVASVLSMLCATCKQQVIPVVAAWQTALKDGATAACGMDYASLGERVGALAIDVLKGKSQPGDIGVVYARAQVVVNEQLLKECARRVN